MTDLPKPEPAQVNPIVIKAAAGIRKRRTGRSKVLTRWGECPGQLSLFSPEGTND